MPQVGVQSQARMRVQIEGLLLGMVKQPSKTEGKEDYFRYLIVHPREKWADVYYAAGRANGVDVGQHVLADCQIYTDERGRQQVWVYSLAVVQK